MPPTKLHAGISTAGMDMVDGFHWTRVTSKQLRFLYEEITQSPVPEHMRELARSTDRCLAGETGEPQPLPQPATPAPTPEACVNGDAAVRNPNSRSGV